MTDEYQSIKVADARAAVQASGQLAGFEGPLYAVGDQPAIGGLWWRQVFKPSDDHAHPDYAKVTITRAGQTPREVVISWDEYAEQMDADPEWDALRTSKPMSIFGAEVERHAYRVVFADVLAEAFPPRIIMPGVVPPQPWEPRHDRLMVVPDAETSVRDWIADVKAAANAVELNALYDEAREAGALAKVDGLQAAIMDRTLDLEHPPKPKPAGPRPQGQPRRRRGKPRP